MTSKSIPYGSFWNFYDIVYLTLSSWPLVGNVNRSSVISNLIILTTETPILLLSIFSTNLLPEPYKTRDKNFSPTINRIYWNFLLDYSWPTNLHNDSFWGSKTWTNWLNTTVSVFQGLSFNENLHFWSLLLPNFSFTTFYRCTFKGHSEVYWFPKSLTSEKGLEDKKNGYIFHKWNTQRNTETTNVKIHTKPRGDRSLDINKTRINLISRLFEFQYPN